MAATTVKTQRVPRHAYFRQVAGAMPPRGATNYDLTLASVINKDAYSVHFDDFLGDSLHDMYTAKNSTGATTVAASTAILASTAGDNLYAGFTGGDIGWTGGQNCMLQTRFKISSAALTEVKYEVGWHGAVAGSAGLFNDIDAPSWVGTTAGVLFGYDADGTEDVWQAGAYSSVAPKKRTLHNTGTATASSATTLTQATYTWIVNAYGGLTVTAGTAPNLTRGVIATNSATVLTLAGGWSNGTPASTATYVISNFYNATAANSPTIPKLDTYHTYTIKIEQLMALYYIDGIQVAAIPAAVAATTTGLTPWFFAQARGDGSENAILTVDYLWCIQSRNVTA